MKGLFKAFAKKLKIHIIGLEYCDYQYVKESSSMYQAYEFEDTYSLNVVHKVNSKGEETFHNQNILIHKLSDVHTHKEDMDYIDIQDDGLYKIRHIIIPTVEWLACYISTYGKERLQNTYENIYVTDGIMLYKYCEYLIPTCIEEILAINPESSTTLCISEKYVFSIYNLLYCYYKLICALLDNLCPLDECSTGEDDLWYKLHLILIQIYVILFLLEKGRYLEALELLELLSGCAGPCSEYFNNINNNLKTKADCGCSK